MDIEDKTENEPLDEQPLDETLEGVEDAQAQEDEYHVIPLKGMFENWFLDYASYVILERAVPAIEDGLKLCSAASCIRWMNSTTVISTRWPISWATR